jgi:hypothetical protein
MFERFGYFEQDLEMVIRNAATSNTLCHSRTCEYSINVIDLHAIENDVDYGGWHMLRTSAHAKRISRTLRPEQSCPS